MTDFGTGLTRLMHQRDVSVRGLAKDSGYSKTYISQLCHGQRNPSPVVAQDLDDTLQAQGKLAALAGTPAPRTTGDTNEDATPRPAGATLRRWRMSRHWAVPEMARQIRHAAGPDIHVADPDALKNMIHKWERDGVEISERYMLLYCKAFGVTPEHLIAGPARPDRAQPPDNPAPPADPYAPASQERAVIGRSDFLILTGAVIALLDVIKGEMPARLAATSAGQTRMDDETADGLASVVLGYRQVYRSAAPSSLLDPVCGAIGLLTDLAPEAGQHRDKIVSLIGQASSLAATLLMLDQGDFDAATRYAAIATRAARQSGDDELMAISLAVRAFHACYLGDPPDGLAFAVEAQRVAGRASVHPLSRGWINAVTSEMYATTGDQQGFERALAAAHGSLQEPDPGTPWEGIGVFSDGKLTAYEGGGWLRLGKYEAAQTALHQALGQLDTSCLKHRCTAHIDLADAYSRNGQADEAANHGMAALTIVANTRHAESLRRIGLLDASLWPYGTHLSKDLHSAYMEARAAT